MCDIVIIAEVNIMFGQNIININDDSLVCAYKLNGITSCNVYMEDKRDIRGHDIRVLSKCSVIQHFSTVGIHKDYDYRHEIHF